MPWTIGAVWVALAYATESSLATFSASAALIGAATFAFTSDIAARSGSGSPASVSSSSRVSGVYCVSLLLMRITSPWWSCARGLHALRDRGALRGVGVGDGAVREDVGRQAEVHRHGEVRVHERHRCALGQLLAGERVELVAGEWRVLLVVAEHVSVTSLSCCWTTT